MNQMLNSKILTGLVIIAVFGLGYYAYSSLSSGSGAAPAVTSPVSKELLIALSNLHTIELDGGVFSDPTFQSLNDFGVTIPPQPVGRRNPFQPTTSAPPASGGAAPLPGTVR